MKPSVLLVSMLLMVLVTVVVGKPTDDGGDPNDPHRQGEESAMAFKESALRLNSKKALRRAAKGSVQVQVGADEGCRGYPDTYQGAEGTKQGECCMAIYRKCKLKGTNVQGVLAKALGSGISDNGHIGPALGRKMATDYAVGDALAADGCGGDIWETNCRGAQRREMFCQMLIKHVQDTVGCRGGGFGSDETSDDPLQSWQPMPKTKWANMPKASDFGLASWGGEDAPKKDYPQDQTDFGADPRDGPPPTCATLFRFCISEAGDFNGGWMSMWWGSHSKYNLAVGSKMIDVGGDFCGTKATRKARVAWCSKLVTFIKKSPRPFKYYNNKKVPTGCTGSLKANRGRACMDNNGNQLEIK